MSGPGSHQGYDFPPDYHIEQGQDFYSDPSLQPFDSQFRPFGPPLRHNPYDGGVVDSNQSQPIEAPGYPFVNEPSTSYQLVPRLQDAKWTFFVPRTDTIPSIVMPLEPGDDSIQFVHMLHDFGVHRWTLSSDVDDLKVPHHLTRDVSTMPSPGEGDSSVSTRPSSSSLVLQTAYSGVNNSYNDIVVPQRHQGDIGSIIEKLPYPLKTVAQGWSGRVGELVVEKMLGTLEMDIEGIYQYNPSSWRKILDPLCGPKGKLCTVERNGPQGGVTSVTCNQNDCNRRFSHNPAEKFARHLISEHWRIHPFKCERCEYTSDYAHDRKRHQRTCEGI